MFVDNCSDHISKDITEFYFDIFSQIYICSCQEGNLS